MIEIIGRLETAVFGAERGELEDLGTEKRQKDQFGEIDVKCVYDCCRLWDKNIAKSSAGESLGESSSLGYSSSFPSSLSRPRRTKANSKNNHT